MKIHPTPSGYGTAYAVTSLYERRELKASRLACPELDSGRPLLQTGFRIHDAG